MMNWFKNKQTCHPGESRDPAASVCEQKNLSTRGRASLDADLRRHDDARKYRMLGLALAAIAANIGFSAAHDPSFSMGQAVLLVGLCIAATYAVHEGMIAAQALVRICWSKKGDRRGS
jgi:hypothetical protein